MKKEWEHGLAYGNKMRVKTGATAQKGESARKKEMREPIIETSCASRYFRQGSKDRFPKSGRGEEEKGKKKSLTLQGAGFGSRKACLAKNLSVHEGWEKGVVHSRTVFRKKREKETGLKKEKGEEVRWVSSVTGPDRTQREGG